MLKTKKSIIATGILILVMSATLSGCMGERPSSVIAEKHMLLVGDSYEDYVIFITGTIHNEGGDGDICVTASLLLANTPFRFWQSEKHKDIYIQHDESVDVVFVFNDAPFGCFEYLHYSIWCNY